MRVCGASYCIGKEKWVGSVILLISVRLLLFYTRPLLRTSHSLRSRVCVNLGPKVNCMRTSYWPEYLSDGFQEYQISNKTTTAEKKVAHWEMQTVAAQ